MYSHAALDLLERSTWTWPRLAWNRRLINRFYQQQHLYNTANMVQYMFTFVTLALFTKQTVAFTLSSSRSHQHTSYTSKISSRASAVAFIKMGNLWADCDSEIKEVLFVCSWHSFASRMFWVSQLGILTAHIISNHQWQHSNGLKSFS